MKKSVKSRSKTRVTPRPSPEIKFVSSAASKKSANGADARFRTLMEFSSDWFWEQDENFRFTNFTWRADGEARFFTPGESIGKTRWELPYVGVTEEQWKAHKAVLNEHQPFYDLEFKRRYRDGSFRYCSISGIPIFDAGGTFKGYRGIGRDVTDQIRSKAREAVALSIAQHLAGSNTIGEAMPNILRSVCEIMDWDYGAYWQLNEAKEKLHCAQTWSISSLTDSDFMAFNRDNAGVNFTRGDTSKNKSGGVIRRVSASRESIWIEDLTKHHWTGRMLIAIKAGLHSAFAFPITVSGETFGIMEFFSDEMRKRDSELLKMTYTIGSQIGQFCHRKQSEGDLRQANQALETLVQTSPLAICTCNADGQITLWNPAAARMFGWSESEAVTRRLPLAPSDNAAEFEELREQIGRGESPSDREFSWRRKDGSLIHVNIASAALRDARGKSAGFMVVATDISERKEAERHQSVDYELTRLLASGGAQSEIMQKVLEVFCTALGWTHGAYWGLDQRDNVLRIGCSWSDPNLDVREFVSESEEQDKFNLQRLDAPQMGGVIRRAYLTQRPVWIVDVTADSSFRRAAAARKLGFKTVLAFPVPVRNSTYGVMEFFGPEARNPDERLMHLSTGIGTRIGQFIERKQADARQAMEHVVTRILAESSSPNQAIARIIRTVCETFDWYHGAYWSRDGEKGNLRCLENWSIAALRTSDFLDRCREGDETRGIAGLVERTWNSGEPTWIADITGEPEFGVDTKRQYVDMRSAFAFPITIGKEILGVMEFLGPNVRQQDELLLRSAHAIGSQIGQFYERRQAQRTLQETNQTLQALVNTSPLAIYTYDLDGFVTLWNPAATRIFGWTESEAVGRLLPLVQNEKMEEFRLLREKMKRGEWLTNLDLVRRKKDGSRIDISVSTAPLRDANGHVYGIMGLTADITERKQAEVRQELEHALTRLLAQRHDPAQAIAKIIEIICQTLGWDYGAYWGFVNRDVSLHRVKSWGVPEINVDEFVKQSEYEAFKVQRSKSESPGGLIRRAWFYKQALWTEDVTEDPSFRRAPLAKKIGFKTGFAFPVIAGQEVMGVMEFFVRDRRRPDEGLLQTCQSIGRQIGQYFDRQYSETRQAVEHAVTRLLAESESPSKAMPAVLETICKTLGWQYGGYWKYDEQSALLRCVESWCVDSPRAVEFSKESRSLTLTSDRTNMVGRTLVEGRPVWITNVVEESVFRRRSQAKAAGLYTAFAFPIIIADEKIGVLEFFASDVRQPDEILLRSAQMIGIQIGQFFQRKRAEQDLLYIATHDSLTALPNRGMFHERLNHALARARRHDTKLSICFIDLDRFKNINDTLGHEAGDRLLQEMGRRLGNCLRETDTVARQGGDEFIVLLEELSDPQQAAKIAAKILSVVATPVLLNAREYQLTASIGISTYPDDGQDGAVLLKNADSAMYRAKELGKNNFQFYSAQMNLHSLERLELEAQLRRAIERNEFLLHYQPKVNIRTGQVNGVEALLRWQHPDRGLVPPMQFIPLAEETGLIESIGRWVLQSACRQVRSWQKLGLPPLNVAVNLSARQFSDDNLIQDIKAALTASGLDPTHLELEITESMVMRDTEKAVRTLSELSAMGLRVAIDDFGTGYSSLSALKRFPVHNLKIDRSFIKDIPGDADNVAITQAIIALAHTLRMTVIAEGVETKEQSDFLSTSGCDDLQGYFFSKPLPEKELLAFLHENLESKEERVNSPFGQ